MTCRVVGGLAIALSVVSPAQPAELSYRPHTSPHASRETAAATGGRTVVSMRDVHDGLSIAYYEMARAIHRRQTAWTRWFVGEQLLAARAQSRNMSIQQLLRAETGVSSPSVAVPDDARQQYIDRLWREARIEIRIPEPDRPQVLVNESTTGPVSGGFQGDAPLNVVEFCSFTSAECREAWKTLARLAQHLGSELRIAHRDLAPPEDLPARRAAIAARCAHRQGKFWPYQALLYDDHETTGDEASLRRHARTLNLDAVMFDRCLVGRETEQEIDWDVWEARRVGITRLPALFVNATYVSESLPFDEMLKLFRSLAVGGGPGSKLR